MNEVFYTNKSINNHIITHYKVLGLNNLIAKKIFEKSKNIKICTNIVNLNNNTFDILKINSNRNISIYNFCFFMSKIGLFEKSISKKGYYNYITLDRFNDYETICKNIKQISSEEKTFLLIENIDCNFDNNFISFVIECLLKNIKTKKYYSRIINFYNEKNVYITWPIARKFISKKFDDYFVFDLLNRKNIEHGARGKIIEVCIQRKNLESHEQIANWLINLKASKNENSI